MQVLCDDDRDSEVFYALQNVAGHFDQMENMSRVALEDGLGDAECNVGAHVEEGPAELLDRNRVQVPADRHGCETRAPRLVVGSDRIEQLLQIFLFEPAVVVDVVEIPE